MHALVYLLTLPCGTARSCFCTILQQHISVNTAPLLPPYSCLCPAVPLLLLGVLPSASRQLPSNNITPELLPNEDFNPTTRLSGGVHPPRGMPSALDPPRSGNVVFFLLLLRNDSQHRSFGRDLEKLLFVVASLFVASQSWWVGMTTALRGRTCS